MSRIVGLKLVAALDPAELVRGTNLYGDCANLTRLDDFFKVKVAWGTSAGRGGSR
jgi:hypothetical protein